MKLIWVFLVVVAIDKSRARSVFNVENIKKDVTKELKPSLHDITTKRSSIFPSRDKAKKFLVKLNPILKSDSQTSKPEQYRKRLMKKLSIKDIHYKNHVKVTTEVTTRRSLMKTRKFTVRPHDVFVQPVRENNNWNQKTKLNTYNLNKPKVEKYNTEKSIKSSNQDDSLEDRFVNFKTVDINENDLNEFGKQHNKNSYFAAASQKLKTILLFPKRRNSQNFKLKSQQNDSKHDIDDDKNNSDSKTFSTLEANQTHNDTITEQKTEITNSPNDTIIIEPKSKMMNTSNSTENKDLQKDEEIKANKNFSEQEKKTEEVFITVKKDMSLTKPTIMADEDKISTDLNHSTL